MRADRICVPPTLDQLGHVRAIEGALDALNNKITADYKAGVASGDYTGALARAKQELMDGRLKLIDSATQLGINQGAAKGLVDQLLTHPITARNQVRGDRCAGRR